MNIYMYIIIISSLPFGRSLASMPSTSLYHRSSFSFRWTILLLNRQSCPSLVSLVASFPPSSLLTLVSANYCLERHALSSPFSYIHVYIYIYIYMSSSSLVLCPSAGPWHPRSPRLSIIGPPFHFGVRSFFYIVNHAHPWSPSWLLSL